MALLRVALLCQLFVSVAGADRAATNVVCLMKYPEEVFLDLTGARTTALPKGIPQADALASVAQARACCTTTWAGWVISQAPKAPIRSCQMLAWVRSKTTRARRQWVRWPLARRAPGVGPPHRAPHHACAVIGNVTDPDSAYRVTNEAGVVIDLYIETKTPGAPYAAAATNKLRDGADGTPTFGEINLQGPDVAGTREVELTFTFKRHDTGAEVQIPWMQFTLFDFDQNMGDWLRGQEVNPTPRPPHPTPWESRPPTRAHGVRGANGSARQPRDLRITRSPAGRASSLLGKMACSWNPGWNSKAASNSTQASTKARAPARKPPRRTQQPPRRLCAADAPPRAA